MKYFLDTEFDPGINARLISLALVREDGEFFYREATQIGELDESEVDSLFVRDNVLPHLRTRRYKDTMRFSDNYFSDVSTESLKATFDELRRGLIDFVGDDPKPQFYAWYGAQDWVSVVSLFDGLFSNMPKNWPGYYYELKVMVNNLGLTKEQVLEAVPKPKDEHFALADAFWNAALYEFLTDPGAS